MLAIGLVFRGDERQLIARVGETQSLVGTTTACDLPVGRIAAQRDHGDTVSLAGLAGDDERQPRTVAREHILRDIVVAVLGPGGELPQDERAADLGIGLRLGPGRVARRLRGVPLSPSGTGTFQEIREVATRLLGRAKRLRMRDAHHLAGRECHDAERVLRQIVAALLGALGGFHRVQLGRDHEHDPATIGRELGITPARHAVFRGAAGRAHHQFAISPIRLEHVGHPLAIARQRLLLDRPPAVERGEIEGALRGERCREKSED